MNSSDGLASTTAREESIPVAQPAAPAVPARNGPEGQRHFQWSQLESTDYRAYIANLRGIGCPEQTLRDIIGADLDSIYSMQRAQLQQKQADPQTLQTQLQTLETEEAGVLLALLGPPLTVPTTAGTSISNSGAMVRPIRRTKFSSFPDAGAGSLPIVFQEAGPEMKLEPDQIEVFNDLRTTFNEELKGLDPASSEYRHRWQEAKRNADQRMCALLGYSFWLEYQIEAKNHHQTAHSQ